jgi:hypothetical protein
VDVSDQKHEYYGVGQSSKKWWQVTFRHNLVHQLIGTFTPRKHTGRNRSLPIGTAFPIVYHTLQTISGCVKVCALCIEKKKKTPSGRGKETKYKCKQCDLPLWHVGCFLEYHQQQNMEVQN